MNPEAQEIFDRLVKLNPEDLTPEDKVFLTARRDYLNNEQKRVFVDVISQQEEVAAEAEKVEQQPELYVSKKDREAAEKA